MDNQDKKRQLIVDAAIKRFAHFGLAKTTMTEIASDLSLSKALLYYYFPDKMSLYATVLEQLIQELNESITKGISKHRTAEGALFYFLERRKNYIQKYYNILDYIRVAAAELPANIVEILLRSKDAEIEIITSIIQIGIDNKELRPQNAREVSVLLMEAFVGMRYLLFSNKQQFHLGEVQFKELLDKQKKIGSIFLRGLA